MPQFVPLPDDVVLDGVAPNQQPNGPPAPGWYKPETLAERQAAQGSQSAASAPSSEPEMPHWYQPEQPGTGTLTPLPDNVPLDGVTPPQMAARKADYGAAQNFLTGLLKVPGAIIGTPFTLAHAVDWGQAQFNNGLSAALRAVGLPAPPSETGANVDKRSAIVGALPTPEGIDNRVFHAAKMAPYQPESLGGDLGQAAVTAGAAGLLDPAADLTLARQAPNVLKAVYRAVAARGSNVARNALAGGAAQATQEVLPDTPGVAAAAAFLTHAGAGAAESALRGSSSVASDAVRQVVQPTKQGNIEAGRVVGKIDNSQPGLATPTAADLTDAQGNVRSATDNIGPGLEPWQAGSLLRRGLQQRVDSLEKAREDATADLRSNRDTSPAIVNTQPVLDLIDNRLKVAAGAQQSALQGAKADLHLADGSPREDAEQLAASRQAINARISDASRAGDSVSASHLIAVRDALDGQINAAVPAAGEYTRKYAEMSKPLDPTSYGPVGTVLDRDQFNSRYTFPDERIPDLFLRSNATRSDLNQLVAAHGGDKAAALGALQDHLAGVAQRAVQPDGTLDSTAFDRAMKPYNKAMNGNLKFWFPTLANKFENAKAAQSTLDAMNAQRSIADAIGSGALRDNTGALTGASFNRWLKANGDALTRTQSPAAVMRLQSMANALQNSRPGELADVLKSEIAPTMLGAATGGLEGGVLATLLHKTTQSAFGGLDAKRQAAFSAAMEQATLDPAYAARIATEAAKRSSPSVSPLRGLVRAIVATPIATNAVAN